MPDGPFISAEFSRALFSCPKTIETVYKKLLELLILYWEHWLYLDLGAIGWIDTGEMKIFG